MNHHRRIQGTSITDQKDGIKLKKIRHRHIQGSSHRKLNKKKISSWFTRKRHVIEEENAPLESSMNNVLECTKPDSNRYHFTFFWQCRNRMLHSFYKSTTQYKQNLVLNQQASFLYSDIQKKTNLKKEEKQKENLFPVGSCS